MIRRGTLALLLGMILASPCQAEKSAGQLIDAGVTEFRSAYRQWSGDGFSQAKSLLLEATKKKPDSAAAHYWLGVARFHQMLYLQRHADAAKHAKRAEWEQKVAMESLERLLEIDPGNAEGHALVATLLGMKIHSATMGGLRFGPSLQKHQKAAMRAGEKNPRVRYLMGVGRFHVAKKKEDYETALKELETANQLFDAEAKMNLSHQDPRWGRDSCRTFTGLTMEKLGRNQEAVAEFKRALALHPQDHAAKKALQRLTAAK